MTLRVHPLESQESSEIGKGEDESLRTTQADFTRLMTHKTVRIISDQALRDQLNSLIGYGRPLEIEGSVTDAVCPMLLIQDILASKDLRLTSKQRSSEQTEAQVHASGPEVASKK